MNIKGKTHTRRETDFRLLNQGFTLVELMLVITIMAIMLGTIVPNYKPFIEGTTLKNAANTFSHIVRYARSLAIERSAVTVLIIDRETGDILLAVEEDPINMPGTYTPAKLPVRYPKEYKTETVITGIEKQQLAGTQQENEISFQPDGTTSDTFIYMADRNENVYTIGIVGLTGQVMVWNRAVQNFYE